MNKNVLKQTIINAGILFSIVLISYMYLGNLTYLSEQFVNEYLSVYRNIHSSVLSSSTPMWSWELFLGHNLLGSSAYYSMYNPLFMISLLFSTQSLIDLYIPILLIKLVLAFLSFFFYFKQTKWFSDESVHIASLVYIFNGWLLTNLSRFVTVELLIFIPLVLYGVERLINDNKRRYFIAAFSLMLISNASVTLCLFPMLMVYTFFRLTKQTYKKVLIRLCSSLALTLGICAIVILPIIVATDSISFEIMNTFSLATLLKVIFQITFPPLGHILRNESIDITSTISVFQSLLVLQLIPQFFKLATRKQTYMVSALYTFILLILLFEPAISFMSGPTSITIDATHFSLLFILVNSFLVAYVMSQYKKIDMLLFTYSFYAYLLNVFVSLAIIFLYELRLDTQQLSFKLIRHELLNLAPVFLVILIAILFYKGYQILLLSMKKEYSSLKNNLMLSFITIEVAVVASQFMTSSSNNIILSNDYIDSEEYIINQTYAVTDYLKTIDQDFYRIVNSFQVQENDPQLNQYPGFSIISLNKFENQMLMTFVDKTNEKSISIDPDNYFATTALSAKYVLAPSFAKDIPGYKFFDQISNVTVYENEYFIPVASRQMTYVLDTDFYEATNEQQQFMFLNSLILSVEQVEELSKDIQLVAYNLNQLKDVPRELDYFEAAKMRQQTGVSDVVYEDNKLFFNAWIVEPTLLTVTIPYDSGWQASANGEQIKIHEVNDGLMALQFNEANEYAVTLTYVSPGYDIGLAITLVSSMYAIVLLLKNHNKNKFLP